MIRPADPPGGKAGPTGEIKALRVGILAAALLLWIGVLVFREAVLQIPVLIGPRGGVATESLRLELEWNPLWGVDSVLYEVEVDSLNGAFEHLVLQETCLSEPELRRDGVLQTGRTYYWRVRGGWDGKPARWSPTATFRTTPLPRTP